MDFGIMFFSSVHPEPAGGRYRLLLEAARFADAEGFSCVWTPERHFHEFGGLFPNPSVLGAALAMVTRRLEIRAGSLISPLHDSLRIAEEWSVVDNLSNGRVAISFGSGWNIDDFVLRPERYEDRQATMFRQIVEVQTLWRGGSLTRTTSNGGQFEAATLPRPIQPELPIWVTTSGKVETFARAGSIGANLLTHLIGQDLGRLTEGIRIYREAREKNGFDPARGKVSLMLHTFLGDDPELVRKKVRSPFQAYLRSALSLEKMAAAGGGAISGGHRVAPHEISPTELEDLLDLAFERYYRSASLLGTTATCTPLLWQLEEAGVDEIACLIDFIDDFEAVMDSLGRLADLRESFAFGAHHQAAGGAVAAFLEDLEA